MTQAFEPRTGVRPLWLHTIELDPDRALAGAVVVVHEQYVAAVAALIGHDAEPPWMVHSDGAERWLRLSRDEAITLRRQLGKQRGDEPEFIPDAYGALVDIENVVDREDE